MPAIITEQSIKHPETFSTITGHTQLSNGIQSINESIRLILTTAPGELFGDPAFGSYLHNYFFEYSGSILTTIIKSEIVRALSLWEPRIVISESDVNVVYEHTTAKIDITYRIRYTDYYNTYAYIQELYREGEVSGEQSI